MEKKTNAQCVKDCRDKNYDMIQFPVPKGERQRIKAYADKLGMSQNEFIRQAVWYAMDNGVLGGVSADAFNAADK